MTNRSIDGPLSTSSFKSCVFLEYSHRRPVDEPIVRRWGLLLLVKDNFEDLVLKTHFDNFKQMKGLPNA